jgi:hypothetical protein
LSETLLSGLCGQLAGLSHNEDAVEIVRQFSEGLRKTQQRLGVFGVSGALVRSPIMPAQTVELGFDHADDQFAVLQGDIVSTESAFFMGVRAAAPVKYVVLNSSCDLVPDRSKFAALLQVKTIVSTEEDSRKKLDLLLKFKRRDAMYLPVFPDDPPEIICNVIEFDGIAQISAPHLQLANRVASLSLVGWRIFASFSRAVIARANPREDEMRNAVEKRDGEESAAIASTLDRP